MKIDSAAWPFVALAVVPVLISAPLAPVGLTVALVAVPVAVAAFFRDPDRTPPGEAAAVLSPADGRVMHAGAARPDEAPPGDWQQITIFLSLLDVHINRTPVAGRVTRVEYRPGTFHAAFKPDAHRNERSEIWLDHDGVIVVVRQVVGVLARRVVCRVAPGNRLAAGQRIGLMKFGSRMDVFLPLSARLSARAGDVVRGGESIVAHLATEEKG